MAVVMLMLIVGGIGLTQAVSDPNQVTLRWLRLGGIVALCLLAVALTVAMMGDASPLSGIGLAYGATFLVLIVQLLAVQTGHRKSQRIGAVVAFVCVCWVATLAMPGSMGMVPAASDAMPSSWPSGQPAVPVWVSFMTTPISAGLMGGFLMAMLLGHAYLTAGNEMTQAPFRRLVLMLVVLLALRTIVSGLFGILPWLAVPAHTGLTRMWTVVMIVGRYGVGLIVPGVFAYMIYDCVNRRANQSATGILYVATVLVILGEGMGFALLGSTGFVF